MKGGHLGFQMGVNRPAAEGSEVTGDLSTTCGSALSRWKTCETVAPWVCWRGNWASCFQVQQMPVFPAHGIKTDSCLLQETVKSLENESVSGHHDIMVIKDLPHFFFLPAVQNFGVALKGFWCDCKGVQGNNI